MPLERSWTGRSIESLLCVVNGTQAVPPLSKVMFRVVARIADVLEGRSHADDSEDVGFVPESAQDEPGLREGVVDNITIFQ